MDFQETIPVTNPVTLKQSSQDGQIGTLIEELSSLRADMIELERRYFQVKGKLDPTHLKSARNLLHYLAFRRHDLRQVQDRLAELGLSSLGRAESHVLATLEAVIGTLHRSAGGSPVAPAETEVPAIEFVEGRRLLDEHTEALLGPPHHGRSVRIMVTMGTEAAEDYRIIHSLLQQGMNCMRINCAHDGPAEWSSMIAHLRHAQLTLGRQCKILMDLGGPKLRTGPLEPGPSVVKWRPRRDEYGKVSAPARVWLTRDDAPTAPPTEADACLPISRAWLSRIDRNDEVKFEDCRGSSRSLRIVDTSENGCWAESRQTAYVVDGTTLRRVPLAGSTSEADTAALSNLPAQEKPIVLCPGDILILTRDPIPGRPSVLDTTGRLLSPARISCTLPEIFDDIEVGERIWLDDGKIGGVIERKRQSPDSLEVRIVQAKFDGEKLRADKGINLPDSHLRLPALTEKDIEDLSFVVKHADMVGMSFVQDVSDVHALQDRLLGLTDKPPGIVLKIETRRAFDQLPALILAAMRFPRIGVMIARGDLAVESGFERMAEVQEEMLWICEAAHCPAIWATQVLESLAKNGVPSRAEITDAAMGNRAECVMLNKGPHIVQAVQTLDNILHRMENHQTKKQSMLRELRLAGSVTFEAAELPQPQT
jgi:pyruvate kinase